MTAQDEIPALAGHPTTLRFGAGIVGRLAAALPPGSRILVVASDGTRQRMGGLFDALRRLHRPEFAGPVPPETTLAEISQLVDAQRGRDCDLILAIGGGATLDAAKALAIGIRNEAAFETILENPAAFADGIVPLIGVPTTSGSGSDITPYATIWDLEAGRKRSLAHERLIPRESWIDPALTLSLPLRYTASSGLDALSHAMEAIWSRNHTPASDLLAQQAIRLIAAHLPVACERPADLAARTAMSTAALAAGLAISVTKTAAAHAASYPLTLHHGLAHGHACAVSLSWLLRWNARQAPERVTLIARSLGEAGFDEAARAIDTLIRKTGLPARLRELGVARPDLPRLVEATAASDRIGNTLAKMTTAEIDELFVTIW